MKGIAESLLLKVASLVIVIAVGAILLKEVGEDILENVRRTSTQTIALDISNLISLTHITTGDIKIDYKLDTDKRHSVTLDNRIVNVESGDGKYSFKISLPFDSGKGEEQRGTFFRISKIDKITRVVEQR